MSPPRPPGLVPWFLGFLCSLAAEVWLQLFVSGVVILIVIATMYGGLPRFMVPLSRLSLWYSLRSSAILPGPGALAVSSTTALTHFASLDPPGAGFCSGVSIPVFINHSEQIIRPLLGTLPFDLT